MIRVNDSLNSGKPKWLSAVEHYHRRLSFASRVFSLSRGKFFVLFDCKSLAKEGLTTLHENNRCFTFSGIRCKRNCWDCASIVKRVTWRASLLSSAQRSPAPRAEVVSAPSRWHWVTSKPSSCQRAGRLKTMSNETIVGVVLNAFVLVACLRSRGVRSQLITMINFQIASLSPRQPVTW